MSRFYGTLNAGRSTATKCGHPKEGLSSSCRGWNLGADCWIHPDRTTPDNDAVVIEITAGTNGAGNRLHLATYTRGDGAPACTGGALSAILEAAAAVMVDLDLHASTHGPGPDRRRDDLRAALLRLGVTA